MDVLPLLQLILVELLLFLAVGYQLFIDPLQFSDVALEVGALYDMVPLQPVQLLIQQQNLLILRIYQNLQLPLLLLQKTLALFLKVCLSDKRLGSKLYFGG